MPFTAAADDAEGKVNGTVKDPDGAVVSGASVSLLNAHRAVIAATTTDAEGRFTLEQIAPGRLMVGFGTGFTGRDVTPEAVEPLFEKRMDGFSVAFHVLSHGKIGTSTIQSRATGGVARGTYLFALPGSPGACRDGWEEILKQQLDNRHRPCNLVELMPRLQEHLKPAAE